MSALLFAVALAGAAHALDGNDELVLELQGGARVEGWYVGVDRGVLRLSGHDRFADVPVSLVTRVTRDGAAMPLSLFLDEVSQAQADLDAFREHPPAHPPPLAVAGVSMLYAGAGHAALGDWKGAAGWAAVDTGILAVAAWNVWGDDRPAAALPALALSALIKAAAAGEAAHIARRRRRRMEGLGPLPSSPAGS